MSKMRKILITLLTLISAVCLTLVGCGQSKIQFVDFENKSINFELGEIFDASSYMDVYDVNGNMYLANVKVTDDEGETVKGYYNQYIIEKTYYKVTITIKDGDVVIGTREIIINGVDNTAPHITILDMPSFGVYNQEVFVPITFEDMTDGFNKKLVVEQYKTEKIEGEYVTSLDTANAIVKNTNDFASNGVAFTPTKPGTYKISVYAWDANKTEADARVAIKTYSIKETADAWGEIEAFDSPDALVANYHYYATACEYNELRGEGQLIYVKDDAGNYLDADGNILYKKVDEIATDNRIAFYKKADAQATEYDVLAYYQDMETYCFYDAEGNIAKTKEGCVTVKAEDGVTDYKFNNKFATIGEEWYQELADKDGTTKFGVIKANASQHSYSDVAKRFFFKSSYRDTEFFRTYNDTKTSSWMENPQFDYLSVWMLIMPKDANETQDKVSIYSSSDFHVTEAPVGVWFEYKVSKAELRIQNYYPYYIFSAERTSNPGGYVVLSNTDYYNFDFYFDNFSYAKGADITVGNDALLMGQNVTLDVANCGELTKDDFKFFVGKARDYVSSSDTGEGVLSSKAYNNATNFINENVLIDGNVFTPELESGLTSRKYYVQAMLNEQGLAKNNGEQIYASKVIVVNNVNVSLSDHELGQQVTINASLDGVTGVTFEYFYKETSATNWTELDSNVFTPSKPTSYDVKVVATAGTASVEKVLTKDYTKEISLSVLPATGDNKLLINKDLTIVATLEGGADFNVSVVDANDTPVTVTDGKINVATMGVYTVTATCSYNGVLITEVMDIRVAGPAAITATMPATAVESVDESVEITASTSAEYTLKYSAKLPTGTIIALNGNVLPVGLVGDYEVYVTAYNGEDVPMGEEILQFTVTARTWNDYKNYGIVASFASSDTVISAYRASTYDSNGTIKVDSTYKGETGADSVAQGTLEDGTPWKAEWHDVVTDKNGVSKFGVISTRAQFSNKDAYTANPIYFRSDMISTGDVYQPFFGNLPYSAADDRIINAIEYDGYDYLSVPVYIPKADATDGETTKVYLRYNVDSFEIPYNTWYEIKINKEYLATNMSSDRPPMMFSHRSASGACALFYMSTASDSADAIAAAKDQVIYVDGFRTAKYDDQDFTSAKLIVTDETGATNGAEVGRTPAFTTDSTGACEAFYFKPELYVGNELVPIEDITVDYKSFPNYTVTLTDGVYKISKFSLSNGALRSSYCATLKLSYEKEGVVYRKYFRFIPKPTMAN